VKLLQKNTAILFRLTV